MDFDKEGDLKMSEKVILEDIIVKNGNIDAVDIDGEVAMMDIEKGKYYGFNDVASRIWQLIEKPIAVKHIIDNLLSEYEIGEEVCETTVIDFLSTLYSEDLILKSQI